MPYDAFISYSHAADGKLAPAVQKGLQYLAKPWYRLRNLSVFRDKSNLSATPSLWASIETALSEARFFVLFASPESAVSPWVKKELEFWKNNKPLENLLIVQTSGEISWDSNTSDFDWSRTNAISDVLAGYFKDEPFYIDLAWANSEDDVSLRNPRFQTEVARLASPIHGRQLDEMVGEDLRQHKRTVRLVRIVVVALLMLLLVAVSGGYFAYMQKLQAERQTRQAFARELAMRSQTIARDEPELALQLARNAVQGTYTADQEVVPEAESVLYELLSSANVLGELQPPATVNSGWQWIWGAQFNSDGSRIGVVSQNGAGLWDAGLSLKGFTPEEALSLSFSKDGQQLAVAERSGNVRIFDATGNVTHSFRSHNARATTVSFLPDGERLVVTGCDKDGEYLKCEEGNAKIWRNDHHLVATLDSMHGWITAACVDALGQRVVTVTEDGKGMLWTTEGKLLKQFDAEANWVSSNCFSPDGQQFVTGGCPVYQRPYSIMRGVFHEKCMPKGAVWSLQGRRLASLSREGKTVNDAGYVTNSGRISVTYNDGTTELRDSMGRATQLLTENASVSASTADGASIITVNDSGNGGVWSHDGRRIGQFTAHPAYYIDASVDPSQPRVLTTSCDRNRQGSCWRGSIRLRGIQGPLLAILDGHNDGVRKAIFNDDGTQILTIDGKGDARIWNRNGTFVTKLTSKHGAIRDGFFHSKDNQITTLVCGGGKYISSCSNGALSSWTLGRSPKETLLLSNRNLISMEGHSADHYVISVGCSAESAQPCSFKDREAYLSDLATGKQYPLSTHGESVVWAGFGKDPERVVIVTCTTYKDYDCESSKVTERDFNGDIIAEIPDDAGAVRAMAYDAILNRLLVAGKTHSTLWDLDSGSLIREFETSSPWYSPVAAIDKESVLLSSEKGLELWTDNLTHRKTLSYPPSPGMGTLPPLFSPTGSRFVALGCQEPSSSAGQCRREGLWMWDSAGTFIAILQSPSKDLSLNISAFAFGPKGERLATGETSGRVQLWGKQGNLLTTLGTQQGSVISVEFSPDGGLLLTGSAGGEVRLWKLWGGPGEMLNEVNRRVTNDMGDDECRRYLHVDTCQDIDLPSTVETSVTPTKFVAEYFKSLEEKNASKATTMWEAEEQKINSLTQAINNADWYRLLRLTPLYESTEEAAVLAELVSKERGKDPHSWRIKVLLMSHYDSWRIVRIVPVS